MHFFSHPLIDIIAQQNVMNKSSLFSASGLSDKRAYNKDFQKLIDDWHIVIGDHDRIYPRFLSLIVSDKETGLFVKEINLKYIPADELKTLTGYDEDDESFIDGLMLKPEHRGLFEAQNGLKMDFDRYEYCLMVGYANLAYKEPVLKRKLTFIHLDGHRIFAQGMRMGVRDKYFPDSAWHHFLHPHEALAFIEGKCARNESINLVITDIKFPGLNGYEFARAIRDIELKYNMFRTPIMAVSMLPEENPLVQAGLSEGLFERYFPKSIEGDIMGNYMKSLLSPDPFMIF